MLNFNHTLCPNGLHHQTIFTILLVLKLLFIGIEVQAQPDQDYVENQIIIKLKEGVQPSEVVNMKQSLNAVVVNKLKIIDAELWNISELVEEAISQYQSDPRIEYIEPNYTVYAIQTIPNDPSISKLWGLNNTGQTGGTLDADIDAPEAWNIQTGGNVLVGVIDTGVDWTHEDLADNIWANPGEIPDNGIDDDGNGYIDDVRGWDFSNGDNNPMDDHSHGTHVSGTIAAVGDNEIGVAGVCWSAQIMPLKFLNSAGSGNTSDAILAIEYATLMGAKLTSNSWSGGEFSQALYDAIKASEKAGMLFIAAAGNNSSNNDTFQEYPSSYDLDNIIAVAATDHNDELAGFSNWGATSVDLGAPGSNIYSTFPGNTYGTFSGTSMATPHVSGVVALIWSQNPNLTNSQVKDRIVNSVDPIPALDGITVTRGRLNAFNALAEPDSIPPNDVTNLATIDPTSNSITLTWTASGDDGISGMASNYDVRYATFPIDDSNFNSANGVSGEPKPQEAGSQETFTVTGLDFNTTYFFALKVFDEWGNGSPVSNSPSATTLGTPNIAVTPNSLSETLSPENTSTQSLTISNVGEGTLTFDISVENAGAPASTTANFSGAVLMKSIKSEGDKNNRKSRVSQKLSGQTGSNDVKGRDSNWIYEILHANERVAAGINRPIAEALGAHVAITPAKMSADGIWINRRQSSPSVADPIYAVVLDGVGTWSANNRLWDELNANWSQYGDKKIVIDYATFHEVEITYEDLVASAADVLIISNNWNSTHEYGPFSEVEAKAIAQYVEKGAGLYISSGTFNNGEFPELQPHVDHLAPLVGLSATETYFWNGNTYGPLNYEASEHPILRDIPEPFTSGWQNKTAVPLDGVWTSNVIPTGTLVGISENGQTSLVVYRNRVYHAGLPEHATGTESDKQFMYNAVMLAGSQPSWLSVLPAQGTVRSGMSTDVTVTFDATGLESGDYNADIVISSNGLETPFIVPVHLNVSEEDSLKQLEIAWCDDQLDGINSSQDTVYICLNDATGKDIISYQLEVTFDENVLDAVGAISAGTISEPFGPPTVNAAVNGEITVGGFGTQPLSGGGALVGLIFDVIGNPGDATEFCFRNAIFNSGDPVANISDSCLTFTVLDFNEFDIAGKVMYGITHGPVGDVTLTLSGGVSNALTTGANGDYLFEQLQGGLNYTVTPTKTGDFDTNSCNCFDGALIAQSVVGQITLTPEQQKAADVNGDGNIFTFDAALICRFAVGLPPFNENEQTGQWRFDPRSRSYTALNSDHTSQNFVATLLGDVDGSWKPETVAKETAAFERYGYWEDLVASPGELVSLRLNVENIVNVLSADIDLQYDPKILRFVEVAKTDLSETFQVVTNAEVGRLRVGTFGTEALTEDGTLLLLRFEVIGRDGQRSYLNLGRFQLNGGLVKNAAAELVVGAATAAIPKQFALGQNYPNPFNPETTIRFDIPDLNGENVKTRLFIYKVTGQLVRVLVNEEKPAGSYEIKWDGRDKSGQSVSSGVYFYKLTAGDFTATQKMTLLK